MTIQEWLQKGRPQNEPFIISRRIIIDETDGEEGLKMSIEMLANIVIAAANSYCNKWDIISIEGRIPSLEQPYVFDHKGYRFYALMNYQTLELTVYTQIVPKEVKL